MTPPRIVPELLKLARRRYRQPISRTTWPWRWDEALPTELVTLELSLLIEPDVLYHFEVLRLRLGQEREEAVREAIGLSIARMTVRASRLRKFQIQELLRSSEDDPLLDDYLERGFQRHAEPPSAPQTASEGD